MLDDVGECLGGDEVGRRLHRCRQALPADRQLDRNGRTSRQCRKRGGEPFLGQDRRVDTAGERAQLLESVDDLGVRLGEEIVDRAPPSPAGRWRAGARAGSRAGAVARRREGRARAGGAPRRLPRRCARGKRAPPRAARAAQPAGASSRARGSPPRPPPPRARGRPGATGRARGRQRAFRRARAP